MTDVPLWLIVWRLALCAAPFAACWAVATLIVCWEGDR